MANGPGAPNKAQLKWDFIKITYEKALLGGALTIVGLVASCAIESYSWNTEKIKTEAVEVSRTLKDVVASDFDTLSESYASLLLTLNDWESGCSEKGDLESSLIDVFGSKRTASLKDNLKKSSFNIDGIGIRIKSYTEGTSINTDKFQDFKIHVRTIARDLLISKECKKILLIKKEKFQKNTTIEEEIEKKYFDGLNNLHDAVAEFVRLKVEKTLERNK